MNKKELIEYLIEYFDEMIEEEAEEGMLLDYDDCFEIIRKELIETKIEANNRVKRGGASGN